MTDDRHTPESYPRSPYSALRAWEPERDQTGRDRARALLELHIEREADAPRRLGRRPGRPRLPRRWLAPAVALVVVAGAGGAVASVLLRTQHTNRLAVFTPQGRLASRFHVGSRGSGYCWEASLAAQTRNAYRCFQGNEIHDPCFAASRHAASVACFTDPWQPVTELRLTRPLPRPAAAAQGPALPWTIVTTDGRRCVFMTGATALVANERINYGCTNGTYLIGSPDAGQPLWRIRSVRRFTVTEMHAPRDHFPVVGIRQTIG
jgi:hypothetical protein